MVDTPATPGKSATDKAGAAAPTPKGPDTKPASKDKDGAFLKLDDVNGESVDSKHSDWP